MKKLICTIFSLIIALSVISAKDYHQETSAALKKKDLKTAQTYLKKWEKEKDKDANYYFNWYYYHIIEASMNPELVELKVYSREFDKMVSKGMKMPSVKSMKKAISYMDDAIKLFPDNLDLYVYRNIATQHIRELDKVKSSFVEMINRSLENNNQWYYEEVSCEDGYEAFKIELLKTLQFMVDTEAEDSDIIYLCEALGEKYPEESITSYFYGIYHLLRNEFKEAVENFELAVKREPENYNSVFYLALLYENEFKDKKKAIYWNEYAKKSSDPNIQEAATKNLQRLKGGK